MVALLKCANLRKGWQFLLELPWGQFLSTVTLTLGQRMGKRRALGHQDWCIAVQDMMACIYRPYQPHPTSLGTINLYTYQSHCQRAARHKGAWKSVPGSFVETMDDIEDK